MPTGLPRALTAKEPHVWLAKAKASLARRFSLTRMKELYEAVHVGWYLVALERAAEACDLAEWIAARVKFDGNYNLWSPAGSAITLAARLRRLGGDPARAQAHIARLREHPAYAVVAEPYLRKAAGQAAVDLAAVRAEKSKKWATSRSATALASATYFRETAGHGFYYDAWIDTAALDVVIADGLAFLAATLTSARGAPRPSR